MASFVLSFTTVALLLTISVELILVAWAALQFKVSAFFCSDHASDVRRRNWSDEGSQSNWNSRAKKSLASRTVFLRLATQYLQLELVHGHRRSGIISKKSQSCSLDHPRTRRRSDTDQCVAVLFSRPWSATALTHSRVMQFRHPAPQPPWGRQITLTYRIIYLFIWL